MAFLTAPPTSAHLESKRLPMGPQFEGCLPDMYNPRVKITRFGVPPPTGAPLQTRFQLRLVPWSLNLAGKVTHPSGSLYPGTRKCILCLAVLPTACEQADGFRGLFTPLPRGSFHHLPHRYWFTIGLSGVLLALRDGAPFVSHKISTHVPSATRDATGLRQAVVHGTPCHPSAVCQPFPGVPRHPLAVVVLQPVSPWADMGWLFSVRSLTTYGIIVYFSPPMGTQMCFRFPHVSPPALHGWQAFMPARVAPFRCPGSRACCTPPPQTFTLVTSFVVLSESQGIPQVLLPLFTYFLLTPLMHACAD